MLVVVGLALGLIGVVALRGALETELYGVRPVEPVVIGVVLTALGLVGLAACVLPARSATRVDPIVVLNQQ